MLILRRLGCNLPIEVTYFGDGDLTEDYRVALERFPDVVTRDLISTIADTECGSEERWAYALSWSAKLFALLFSSFREAILIDADASFLQNPQVPFDNTAYVQTGALFFHGRLTRPWSRKRLLQRILPQPMSDKAMGSRFLESESKHMQESGVVVVDRWRHFMALSMVARINGSEHNRNAAEENIRLYETPYGKQMIFQCRRGLHRGRVSNRSQGDILDYLGIFWRLGLPFPCGWGRRDGERARRRDRGGGGR